jgi:hypothetical protein
MISEGFRERTVRPIDLWAVGPFRLKVYEISYSGLPLSSQLRTAAKAVVEARIRESAEKTNHYGVGFVGVHEGKTGSFVFVDWWADENELHHHVYVASLAEPTSLAYSTPTGLTACVWDLALIGHERDAWVRHVLARPSAPDLEGYLADLCDEAV